jgi:hypothetical protein
MRVSKPEYAAASISASAFLEEPASTCQDLTSVAPFQDA